MIDLLAELRRRIDAPPGNVSDEILTHFLGVSDTALEQWLSPDAALYQDNVDEATVQLAVKMWDTAARGVTSLAPDGEWTLPAASATPGMVRSAFPALGPALRMGGLSV